MAKSSPRQSSTISNLKPATENQALAMEALRTKDVIILEGVAGTGKTYISVHYALQQFFNHVFSKVILTRPLINVGDEKIGFLPGEVDDKIRPYAEQFNEYMNEFMPMLAFSDEKKVQNGIDFIPLAYIRGRNFANSLIIADEMQNSTELQMKTLLTRAAEGTKIIILGDTKQSDKPSTAHKNGLTDIIARVKSRNSDHFAVITFTKEDILRSSLVKEVLEMYGDI